MKNIWVGTSYHDDVINLPYNELVKRLGEPTHSCGYEDADKVQQEWLLTTDENVPFTIYDWKEYDQDVTDGEIIEWHIGHHNNKGDIESIVAWLSERNIKVEKDKYYKLFNY